MNWKVRLMIPVALALISGILPRLSVYSMQEAFVILVGFAMLFVLVLFAAIAVLSIWHGLATVVSWTRVLRASDLSRYSS